jgi:hypothetical protein
MRCRSVQRRLVAYLDGELASREHTAVAAHIDGCVECAAEARRLRRLYGLVDSARATPSVRHLESEIRMRLLQLPVEPNVLAAPERRRRWAAPVALASAAGAGLLVGRLVLGGRWPAGEGMGGAQSIPMKPASPIGITAAPSPTEDPVPAAAHGGGDALVAQRASDVPSRPVVPSGAMATGARDAIPMELREAFDLFVEFPIIRDLEKFEHYDAILARPGPESDAMRGG